MRKVRIGQAMIVCGQIIGFVSVCLPWDWARVLGFGFMVATGYPGIYIISKGADEEHKKYKEVRQWHVAWLLKKLAPSPNRDQFVELITGGSDRQAIRLLQWIRTELPESPSRDWLIRDLESKFPQVANLNPALSSPDPEQDSTPVIRRS